MVWGEQRPQGGCAGIGKEGNSPFPFSRYQFTQAIVGNGELPIEKNLPVTVLVLGSGDIQAQGSKPLFGRNFALLR